MKINCNKIIISAFKLEENRFFSYFEELKNAIMLTYPAFSLQNRLKVCSEQDFTKDILSDARNVGICYSSIGVLQTSSLNRVKGIRAAIVHNKYISQMCRKHNDANVCIIGIQSIGVGLSTSIVLSYLESGFDDEERNMIRVGKMKDFQQSCNQV